jgi:predicted small secreted protein
MTWETGGGRGLLENSQGFGEGRVIGIVVALGFGEMDRVRGTRWGLVIERCFMIRLAVMTLLLCGLGLAGCTNTVRGLGKDLGMESMQRYNARGDVVTPDVDVHYDSRTATEVP